MNMLWVGSLLVLDQNTIGPKKISKVRKNSPTLFQRLENKTQLRHNEKKLRVEKFLQNF